MVIAKNCQICEAAQQCWAVFQLLWRLGGLQEAARSGRTPTESPSKTSFTRGTPPGASRCGTMPFRSFAGADVPAQRSQRDAKQTT